MTLHRCALLTSLLILSGAPDVAGQTSSRQLVVPFDSGPGEPQSYWLGEASAVILTDDLSALGALAITREDRVRAFDRLRVPPAATLSHATVIRVGQLVGAGAAIVGSVEVKGQDLIVRARTIRLDVGRMAPEIVESGPLTDIFSIYARVARRLVPESKVTPEEMEQGHPPIAAFEQYIKGLLAYAPASKVAFLTTALRLDPSFERVRIELWNAYTDLAEHAQALAIVRAMPPTHLLARRARFLAAISMLQLAQYPQAQTTLTELNAMRSDSAILNNLGVAQLRQPAGSVVVAASYFREATQADNTDSDLFFNLGYAHWLQKDLPNTVHWLREAVRRNPADDAAHYVLGVALQANGSLTEAAREKDLAKRLSSDYAEWDAKQGARNEVPRGLERIKADVDAPPALLRMDDVIVAAEQRDQRELARFHFEAGRRAFQAELDSDAISALRRAVYLSPYDAAAHLLLGRAYLRSGRIDEAIDEIKIAIWSDDTVGAHLALADAYVRAREYAVARVELQWILNADPQNVEASRMLGSLPSN